MIPDDATGFYTKKGGEVYRGSSGARRKSMPLRNKFMNYLLSTYRFKAYVKFLWKSTNQHGVHSPFVYQLVTQCFYDYRFHPAYDQLKAQRRHLLQQEKDGEIDHSKAKNTSSGVGHLKEIREMVQSSPISLKRAQLLNRIIRYLEVERALELGADWGQVTAAMVTQNKINLRSAQGCPFAAEMAGQNLAAWGLTQVDVQNLDILQMLKSLQVKEQQGFDLVYVGGHHKPESLLTYFEQVLPLVHNESIVIIEDIHRSPDTEIAWETIKKYDRVRVSIDTFKWGLVFFRSQQVKEHFVIRL